MKSGSAAETYQRFWSEFTNGLAKPESHFSDLKLTPERSEGPTCYLIWRSKEHLKLEGWCSIAKNSMRAQIPIMGSLGMDRFDRLVKVRNTIETEFGAQLVWRDPRKDPIKARGRGVTYFIQTQDCTWDPSDRSSWSRQHEWLARNFRKLYDVFAVRGRLPELSVDEHPY